MKLRLAFAYGTLVPSPDLYAGASGSKAVHPSAS
jgi:hypothetical protein